MNTKKIASKIVALMLALVLLLSGVVLPIERAEAQGDYVRVQIRVGQRTNCHGTDFINISPTVISLTVNGTNLTPRSVIPGTATNSEMRVYYDVPRGSDVMLTVNEAYVNSLNRYIASAIFWRGTVYQQIHGTALIQNVTNMVDVSLLLCRPNVNFNISCVPHGGTVTAFVNNVQISSDTIVQRGQRVRFVLTPFSGNYASFTWYFNCFADGYFRHLDSPSYLPTTFYLYAHTCMNLNIWFTEQPPRTIDDTAFRSSGTVGIAFNHTLAMHSRSPIIWELWSPLPQGLSFNKNTGTITGVPTTAGTFFVEFFAGNSGAVGISWTMTISIDTANGLNITTTTLPNATVGTAFSQTLAATGNPNNWRISAGALPAGLSINQNTGAITGTPTTAGTSNFTVEARNAAGNTTTQAFTMTVNAAALNITTTTINNGTVGTAFSQTLAATGSPNNWSVSAGALPAGLSINQNTGAITGTPTTAGTFNFTVRAQNAAEAYTTRAFTMRINAEGQAVPIDNPHSLWAREELTRAYELNLIPTNLQPAHVDLRNPITREEFAAVAVMVYELLTDTTAHIGATDRFVDTDSHYVLRAYNAGIMVGFSATEFSPHTVLNREQAATALTRAFKSATIPGWTFANDRVGMLTFTWPAPFADDAHISYWARESVYFMAANGIIVGHPGNIFAPHVDAMTHDVTLATATREQALLIAVRMVENMM